MSAAHFYKGASVRSKGNELADEIVPLFLRVISENEGRKKGILSLSSIPGDPRASNGPSDL